MATDLNMPQMGYDMQEGTLVRWLKDEGAEVSVGDPVAEIETDKAVVEFESVAAGVLRKILVLEGATVPVGQRLAIVADADEEVPDVVAAPAPPTEEAPIAETVLEDAAAPAEAATEDPPAAETGVRASPIARRLAEERGIDLARVIGTGPGNRVTRDDVLAYEEAPSPAAAIPEESETPAAEAAPEESPEPAAAIPEESETPAAEAAPEESPEPAAAMPEESEMPAVEAAPEEPPEPATAMPEESETPAAAEAAPEEPPEPAMAMPKESETPAAAEAAPEEPPEPAMVMPEESETPAVGAAPEESPEPATAMPEESETLAATAAPEESPEPATAMPEESETPAAEAMFEESPSPAAAASLPSADEKTPLTRMRQQIARVTVKSKRETPHFYVSAEIDMTAAMALRTQLNKDLEEEGVRISVNDLVLKACIGTLKKYPKFNAYFDDDGLRMNDAINIGIAVAEEEGLIVPAVINSGEMSLVELARASKDLVDRAQSGALRPQEYTGGTFSTSNLGMFDVSSFSAIILPPQSAVLAVGSVAKRPVVRDDEIVIATTMTATISVDHRVADGAEGAQFLVEVKRLLEHPALLLV